MRSVLISEETFENVLLAAMKNEVDYEVNEGTLNDNYYFYGMQDSGVKVSEKPYEYIAIVRDPVNVWQDRPVMIVTDCIKEFEALILKNKL